MGLKKIEIPGGVVASLSRLTGIPQASISSYMSGRYNAPLERAALLARAAQSLGFSAHRRDWLLAKNRWQRIRYSAQKIPTPIDMEGATAKYARLIISRDDIDYCEHPRRWDCAHYTRCLNDVWDSQKTHMACNHCSHYEYAEPAISYEEIYGCAKLLHAIFFGDDRLAA